MTLTALTQRVVSDYRRGFTLALLFDYDGTLTPIVEHPDLARLSRATRALLQRLGSRPRVFLGVLSGRRLDDLRQQASIEGISLAGCSGLEWDIDGRVYRAPHADRAESLLRVPLAGLRRIAAEYDGAWVEDKGIALTLHYRQVRADRRASLLHRADLLIRHWRDSLETVPGPTALEISPTLGWNKGTAVRAMLRQAGSPVLPIYFGDHENDRPAMESVVAAGGFSVGIGSTAPACISYRLPDVESLVAFLVGVDVWVRSNVAVGAEPVSGGQQRPRPTLSSR